MRKIDLSNVKEFESFKRPIGGFVLEIKAVEDVAEKEYLKIQYDIADAYEANDKDFIGTYAKRKAEKGYDFPFTVVSYKSTALPLFKGFCTAIKESNNGYDFEQTFNEAELVGKKFGAVMGEEEYVGKDKNGAEKVRVRSAIVNRRSVGTIMSGDFTVPELKKLDVTPKATAPNPFETASAPTPTPTTEPENNPFATNTEDVPF